MPDTHTPSASLGDGDFKKIVISAGIPTPNHLDSSSYNIVHHTLQSPSPPSPPQPPGPSARMAGILSLIVGASATESRQPRTQAAQESAHTRHHPRRTTAGATTNPGSTPFASGFDLYLEFRTRAMGNRGVSLRDPSHALMDGLPACMFYNGLKHSMPQTQKLKAAFTSAIGIPSFVFRRAALLAQDAGGKTYQVLIPFDRQTQISIASPTYQLANASGNLLAASRGNAIPVFVQSGQPPPTVTLKIIGRVSP